MMKIKAGTTSGEGLIVVIGPLPDSADPFTMRDDIDPNIAPWDAGGIAFSLSISMARAIGATESAATAGEIASWQSLGHGYYQIELDKDRVQESYLGRKIFAKVSGTGFYPSETMLILIVQHDDAALPYCNSSNQQLSTVAPTAASITTAAFTAGAVNNAALGADCLSNAKVADNCFGAENYAAAWLELAGFAADTAIYQASITLNKDGASRDEYTVVLKKNGTVIPFSDITAAPALTVTKRSDGTALINSRVMTRVGTTDYFKWDETSAPLLIAANEQYICAVSFSDGSTRNPAPILLAVSA